MIYRTIQLRDCELMSILGSCITDGCDPLADEDLAELLTEVSVRARQPSERVPGEFRLAAGDAWQPELPYPPRRPLAIVAVMPWPTKPEMKDGGVVRVAEG